MDIIIGDEIRNVCPGYRMVKLEATVVNAETPAELTSEIERFAESMSQLMEIPDINKRPGIAATRAVYKACGKEPNRYRPSAEALCRRMVKGMELYRLTALVDLINLLSVRSGYSIGGLDADKIEGDSLTLGVGRAGEDFEAIGRGQLNIEGLPVYRDARGGVGTPTSDNDRTKLTPDTRRLLMTINLYGIEMPEQQTVELACGLLREYAGATNIKVETVGL